MRFTFTRRHGRYLKGLTLYLECFVTLTLVLLASRGIAQTSGNQCFSSRTKPAIVHARSEWTIDQNAQTVTIRTTLAKTFVDNTYGSGAIGWGTKGHKFNDLVGSDKLQLSLLDGNSAEKMNITLDYISADKTVASGFKTLGVSGGEGKVNVGSAANVVSVKTSIGENLNTLGYASLITNSPVTDANYTPNPLTPNWIYDVWYEVTIKLSAFGTAGFGTPIIDNIHASPSKTGTNEEPVTPISCPVFDLALTKKLKGPTTVFAPGDKVTFILTAYNQGSQAATNVTITDYIPAGLTLEDPNWTTASGGKTTRLISSLSGGSSTTMAISFRVQTGFNGTTTNKAEISSASGGTDIDSTPDNVDGNQPGEKTGVLINDALNGNGKNGGDEDDHDIETITVDSSIKQFDLAIRKVLKDGQKATVRPGDEITFTIQVYNQGTVDATNVVITEYIPSELTLNDVDWSNAVAGKTAYTIPLIEAGGVETVDISFTVNDDPGTTVINKTEISAATNAFNLTDIDSTPDNTDGNGTGETTKLSNNEIEQSGKSGGDEDDHDIETIVICDFPLGGSDLVIFPPNTSADLPDAKTGQSWAILTRPSGSAAAITSPGGVVSGMAINGIYRFVLTGSGGCSDTVTITRNPVPTGGSGELCWVSPTKPNVVSAKMQWTVNQSAGTVTIRTTFARTFVDNTYGTAAIGWGTKGHKFSDLTGSDHLQLALFDGVGTKVLEFKIDYVTATNTVSSGYASLGVSGGEGKMLVGSAANVVGANTSLDDNFNLYGYKLTTNSPTTDTLYTPNPGSPNWVFDVWYEVTVKLSAFGNQGFGQPYITGIHASPSKTGNNTEIVIPGSCPIAVASANNTCEGGTINLLASSAPSGSSFIWSGPNGFYSTQQSPSITDATVDDAGQYILQTKLNQNFASDTVNVLVYPPLTPPSLSSNSGSICIGHSNSLQLYTVTSETGVSYSWEGPNGFTSPLRNPIIPNVTAAYNGSYSLTISRDGCSATRSIPISLSLCPVITVASQTVCYGSSATLVTSGCSGTVRWNTGAQSRSLVTGSLTQTTIYTATCTSQTSSTFAVATVTVLPRPVLSLIASSTLVTLNTPVNLSAIGCVGTVSWSTGVNGNSISVTPTVTSQTYSATCTTGPGCLTTASVMVNTLPPASLVVNSATICYGSTTTLVALGCSGTVRWNTGSQSTTLATGALTQTTNFTATCTTQTSSTFAVATVTVLPRPVLSLIASSTLVTLNTPVSLSAIGCVGTVSWSTGVNGNSISVTPTLPTQTYSASCITGPGCMTTASIMVNTLPPANLVVNSVTVCYGSSATLLALGCSGTVSWNTGSQGTALVTGSLTQTTNYTATCTSQTSSTFAVATVTVLPRPVVSIHASSLTAQAGTSITLTAVGCTGGTLLWSTNQTTSQIIIVPAALTLYTVRCTTGPNCFTTAQLRVGQVPVTLDLAVSSAKICLGQSVSLSAVNCDANLRWDTGQTTRTITVTPTTTTPYSVTCSDDVRSVSASTSITVVPPPSVSVTATSTTVSAGQSATLSTSGCQSGTLTWSTGLIESASVVVSPGVTTVYSVTCSINAICFGTASLTLLVPAVQPKLELSKLVNKTKAQLGEVISYSVILVNTGPVTATNVVVRDSLSSGAVIVPGSVTTSVGSVSLGNPVTLWSIASLPIGATATLTFSASVLTEGIVYNTATIPDDTNRVCTSIPVKFCKGDKITIEIEAPIGYRNYQWYRNGIAIALATGNSFTATEIGEYTVLVDQGFCPNNSCCPVIIEQDSVPVFTVMTQSPACIGNQPQKNGKLTVVGLGNNLSAYRYAIAEGNSFTTTTPVTASVPPNGVLATNLEGDRPYTVRIYNSLDCFRDVTVTITTDCTCPPDICVPAIIRKTKSRGLVP